MLRTLIIIVGVSIPATAAAQTGQIRKQPLNTTSVLKQLPPLKLGNNLSRIQKLQVERFEVANKLARTLRSSINRNPQLMEMYLRSLIRVAEARLELAQTAKERIAILEASVSYACEVERKAKTNNNRGRTSSNDYSLAKYNRLDLEIRLEKEKARKQPRK
jgi:hypothetical protein